MEVLVLLQNQVWVIYIYLGPILIIPTWMIILKKLSEFRGK
jgi:hypothetical protein